ncbi:MAG: retroviral-like aspartic protease family protein [Spirochaetaceae bacterium]|jgi:hypothetical protein|nr:retroviral-like aspartic protease family protein [Spirochaetaceae bacterium]
MARLTLTVPFSGLPQKIIVPITVRQAFAVCDFYMVKQVTLAARAFWDTGSNVTCITHTLAKQLQLIKASDGSLGSIDARSDVPLFDVDLLLAEGFVVPSVPIAGITDQSKFDILIGMNVINRGNFHWDRNGSDSVLTFTVG